MTAPKNSHLFLVKGTGFRWATVPIIICLAVTSLLLWIFFRVVDLKPKVSENFFFSEQDPQLRADNQILKLFPEPPQLIVAVAGDIRSLPYLQRVTALSDELESTIRRAVRPAGP